ncbi:MAG: glycoside hydrolase family 97 C-terminal domain-containing protein, partial [Muribaculaceae bacterium]|nr:glycoside hydrolase family 97 C-terminal domain-containing protein [Muribaculaceae bacterium]
QNPIQNFALAPNNLKDAPEMCMDFLRDVPTTWDETRFIAGYPGKYVVLARRHADKWYIAGVNATAAPIEVQLTQGTKGQTIIVYSDNENGEPVRNEVVIGKKAPKLKMNPRGGFVVVLDAADI